jgi:hypothetical protein
MKLRKASTSFTAAVRLSTRNKSALTGRIFMKFHIWVFFENPSTHASFINLLKPTGYAMRQQV